MIVGYYVICIGRIHPWTFVVLVEHQEPGRPQWPARIGAKRSLDSHCRCRAPRSGPALVAGPDRGRIDLWTLNCPCRTPRSGPALVAGPD